MKKIINNWHYVSVFLAGMVALLAIFLPVNETQKCLLAANVVLLLHFFEEFGFPGGFPLLGIKVLMGSDEMDKTKWNCNNLSSMFGNWGFLFMVYILPIILPGVRFLTLAAMMFLFAEVLMHLVLFNVRLKTRYNAGMITGVFGTAPIGIYYFTSVYDSSLFSWYDFAIAVVWFIACFVFFFRSKVYWGLGKKDGYTLTDQTAFGAGYMK